MAKLLTIFLQVIWRIMLLPYTFLHELSHALGALLVTKEKVVLYVGSYGENGGHLHFRTGRLHWRIKYNLFAWNGGMCIIQNENLSPYKRVLYILMGPLLPFLLALGGWYLCYHFYNKQDIDYISRYFCILTFYYLIVNLIPFSRSVKLADGTETYNDGKAILEAFRYGNQESVYHKAVKEYNQKNFLPAVHLMEQALRLQPEQSRFYVLLMLCYDQVHNYMKAKAIAEQCLKNCQDLNDEQYCVVASVYSHCREYERALQYYNEALKINPRNATAWNNKGYALNLLTYYEQAIPCFTKAIQLNPLFAYAYNNLGLAKIKTGESQEGLRSIKQSLSLDKNNGYAYRNLGIYYQLVFDDVQALKYFKKAKEMNADIPDIDQLLAEARPDDV